MSLNRGETEVSHYQQFRQWRTPPKENYTAPSKSIMARAACPRCSDVEPGADAGRAAHAYCRLVGDTIFRFNGNSYDSLATNKKSLELLCDYDDIRDDDVIVWTYPKSGTHAVADIVWKLMFNGDLERFASHSGELWFECVTSAVIGPHNPAGLFPGSLEELSAIQSPRVIATHVNFKVLPKKVREGKAKVIYVSRNPKDALISGYEMCLKICEASNRESLAFSDYLDAFVNGFVLYGSWAKHIKDFYSVKDNPNILWVQFEELVADYRGQVKRMNDFLGRNLDDETISRIAASSTFDNVIKQFPNSMFLRSGTAGGWKNALPWHRMKFSITK